MAIGPPLPPESEDDASRSGIGKARESASPGPEAEERDEPDPPAPEPLRELTLGRSPVPPNPILPPITGPRADDEEEDLRRIERRCRAKSEAVRWQTECHRRLWEGVETPVEDAPTDPEMIDWSGQLVDCFYWLDDEDARQSAGLSLLDEVGGCYEAVAEAIRLVPVVEDRRGKLERTLPLLAEAQSMLRRSLQRLRAPSDPDQLDVYRLAREAAARHRIYVRRYLKADDPADPSGWSGLLSRIEAVAAGGQQSRQQKEWGDRIRRQVEPIRRGAGTADDWQALIEVVDAAIEDGIPPSNREIREQLLPVIEELPDDREDLPTGFRMVLREIDRYLATRTDPVRPAPGAAPAAEVKEAARLLAGRSVVLIGGIRRPEAQESLRRSLSLKDLIWIETREHQSIEPFEPVVARPDVALVLLAIRWSSHAFGEVRQFCVRHGKPLVRLPRGYGAHQVAVQIIAQASEVLRGERGREGTEALSP